MARRGPQEGVLKEELYQMYGKWHPLSVFICDGCETGDRVWAPDTELTLKQR